MQRDELLLPVHYLSRTNPVNSGVAATNPAKAQCVVFFSNYWFCILQKRFPKRSVARILEQSRTSVYPWAILKPLNLHQNRVVVIYRSIPTMNSKPLFIIIQITCPNRMQKILELDLHCISLSDLRRTIVGQHRTLWWRKISPNFQSDKSNPYILTSQNRLLPFTAAVNLKAIEHPSGPGDCIAPNGL